MFPQAHLTGLVMWLPEVTFVTVVSVRDYLASAVVPLDTGQKSRRLDGEPGIQLRSELTTLIKTERAARRQFRHC